MRYGNPLNQAGFTHRQQRQIRAQLQARKEQLAVQAETRSLFREEPRLRDQHPESVAAEERLARTGTCDCGHAPTPNAASPGYGRTCNRYTATPVRTLCLPCCAKQ